MTGSIEELKKVEMAAGDEISHSDITGRIPEVWGEEIERRAEPKKIFRNYVKINTDLVGRPGDTVKLPKKAYIDFDTYAAAEIGTAPNHDLTAISPDVELEFETVPIVPVEVGMGARITKQAIDEAMVSLIDDTIENMAIGVADKEDKDIVAALTLPEDTTGVTFIEAKKDAATFVTDVWDVAQEGGAQTNITGDDVLDLSVIVEASEVIMEGNGFTADTLIIHPRQKASLLRDINFIDASKAGENTSRKTGVIGTLFGLDVVTSRHVNTITISGSATGYQAILLDASAAGAVAVKRPVTVESKYEPGERMHYVFITSMYKAQRLNNGAVVLINTA